MVDTLKFSQFPNVGTFAPGDIFVGLRGGVNAQFTGISGSGGGGGVTAIITQVGHNFVKGKWVGISDVSGLYVTAQANNIPNAETVGVVIEVIDADNFVLQQAGKVESSQAVFAGLTAGKTYFLSAISSGDMSIADVSVNGQVSRPVFYADSATSGWVLPYRGWIFGQPIPTGGGSGTQDSNVHTVTQNGHGFAVGNWLRVTNPNLVLMQPVYTRAIANSLQNSQAVGVVTEVLSLNQFKIQFGGYNVGAVTVDQGGGALTPSTVYYLSPTVLGAITSVQPAQFSKPLFISEQTAGTTGVEAGWILPQRPFDLSDTDANVHTVIQANTFQKGDAIYVQADATYALAKADNAATSQAAGLVISDADPNQFTVQQSGWNSGAVSAANVDGGVITPGQVLYLSALNAGKLSPLIPTTVGHYKKPMYIQETSATLTGQILPQIPIAITASGGGTGQGAIIQSITSINNTRQSFVINGNQWWDVPGISVTITPTAATSNLKISGVLSANLTASNDLVIRIVRNNASFATGVGTNPVGTGQAGTGVQGSFASSTALGVPFLTVDPAGGVLPITYSLQVRGRSLFATPVTCFINGSQQANPDAFISSLCVEEVQ